MTVEQNRFWAATLREYAFGDYDVGEAVSLCPPCMEKLQKWLNGGEINDN